jgi:hypothetical protein
VSGPAQTPRPAPNGVRVASGTARPPPSGPRDTARAQAPIRAPIARPSNPQPIQPRATQPTQPLSLADQLASQQAKLKPAEQRSSIKRRKTIAKMIEEADKKAANPSKTGTTLTLAEQLQAASNLLKKVDVESIKQKKEEDVKRQASKPTNNTISILAA